MATDPELEKLQRRFEQLRKEELKDELRGEISKLEKKYGDRVPEDPMRELYEKMGFKTTDISKLPRGPIPIGKLKELVA